MTSLTYTFYEARREGYRFIHQPRSEIDTGYPRDTIHTKLLTEVFPTKELYSHRCRIFFATVFKCLTEFLKTSSNPLGALSNVGGERCTEFFEKFQAKFNEVSAVVIFNTPLKQV